jgi:hypothetical protein
MVPPAAPPATPPATDAQQFVARLQASLADGSFQRLVCSRPHGQAPTLDKLLARRVVLRGQDHLAFVWRHHTQDITKNLPLPEAVALVAAQVAPDAASGFHHAHLQTRGHDIQLGLDRKGRWRLRIGRLAPAPAPASAPAPPADATDDDDGTYLGRAGAVDGAVNRQRRHPLTLDLPWLHDLGVTDARGQLVPAMARKWRQINKFVEVLAHAVADSPLAQRDPAQPVRVLDFGAGKGYLTFAVHQHLRASGRVPDVTGVELRPSLTEPCNAVVARLGLQGLRFDAGDVRSHAAQATDIMIALHACDTATDVALHRGITAGAAVILASPCCHRELRPQLQSPPVLAPLLRHGIHQATTAEMLTDALRAQLLELAGYDARVFEFISPEATSKNRMLLAVRRATPLPRARQQQLRDELAALKTLFGIRTSALERLLAGDAAVAADAPV